MSASDIPRPDLGECLDAYRQLSFIIEDSKRKRIELMAALDELNQQLKAQAEQHVDLGNAIHEITQLGLKD